MAWVYLWRQHTPYPRLHVSSKCFLTVAYIANRQFNNIFSKTVDPESIIFDCQRLWQIPEYLFWFNLTWTLPPYLRHGNVISSFTIVPMLKNGTAIISVQIDNVTVPYTEVWSCNVCRWCGKYWAEICLTFALKGNQMTFMWTLKPDNHKLNTTYYLPQHIQSRDYYLKVRDQKINQCTRHLRHRVIFALCLN